ncbi:NYN domain-containing protein [Nocardia sp. NPDC050697]|uniref:NYN domain-containing protein n=1 Tax=Nocardia sp. NPDC050697 TaxID=3155158 RepID=UPI0033DB2A54
MGENQMRLAVLIDADNASPVMAEPLLAEIAKYGTAHVKRAYGDWTSTNLSGWKSHLLRLSIQPVQQFGWTTGRNATDAALIIDAMDLLYSGRFDGFCLVSSDSDFTRLAARLRESGLTVFGMGERKTPRAFVAACDKFVYVENLTPEQPASTAAKKHSTKAPSSELTPLVTAAVEASSDEDGWSHLGAVGNYLSKKQPDFDTRTYGYTKLKLLIEALGAFEVSQRHPAPGKPAVAYVRCRDQSDSATSTADTVAAGQGETAAPQELSVDAAEQRFQLRVPLDQQYRESLLRRIYHAWRTGDASTLGALETVIGRAAPDMDKPSRSILVNSLTYDDAAYALRVLDPQSAPRAQRHIATFDGQPEHQWIIRSHVAWLTFLIYRLPLEGQADPGLLTELFDDPEYGRPLLAEAQTIAGSRRTNAATTHGSEEDAPAGQQPPLHSNGR